MSTTTDDLRIRRTNQLISPEKLIADVDVSARAAETVANARQSIHRILAGEDDRLLVIVGPCSIHDPAAVFIEVKPRCIGATSDGAGGPP